MSFSLIDKILVFFSRKWVYHSIFWLVFLLLLVFGVESKQTIIQRLLNETINLFFYGFLVYFNLYNLIPNYFLKKKSIAYFSLLMVVSFLLTPIKVFTLSLWFYNQPDIQEQLLENFYLYFFLLFIVGLGSTGAKIIKDFFKNQRERQILLQQNMQTELQFLKNQINPHFLFNTLNNLYSLTLKKSDLAPDIVLKLSDMMRYMLYECNEKVVNLEKEVSYLENYLMLEKLRFKSIEKIEFEVIGETANFKIPPLLIIPFFENAFKHGASNPYISSQLWMEEDALLRFHISNKKTDTTENHRGGIGLVNVKRRLELMFPNQYDLEIINGKEFFIVNLKIMLSHAPNINY
jgi:two-component system, LytTR family, sensor kinase